jgi:hypothetical protein
MSGSPIPLEPGNNEAWIVDVDGVRVEIAVVSDEPLPERVGSEVRQSGVDPLRTLTRNRSYRFSSKRRTGRADEFTLCERSGHGFRAHSTPVE